MFEFFNFARERRLNLDQLQTIQMVAQQVVRSLEGSVRIPGAQKKALALQLVGDALDKLGIVAPDSLIDISIEASVKLLKALESGALPPRSDQVDPMAPAPRTPAPEPQEVRLQPKIDVSGRPPNGNSSDKGLSL
jgi:hypothetical protein